MKRHSSRPTIFLRLFLSHLLLLLLCFAAGLGVFDFIFAPGVSLFMERTAAILLPVLLALIGVAGLLALWASAGITISVEKMTDRLLDPAAQDGPFANSKQTPQEIAELIAALNRRLSSSAPAIDTPGLAACLCLILDRAPGILGPDCSL